MAGLLAATLGCISLLYLQLPGSQAGRPGGGWRLVRPREPAAQSPSSGLKPPHPAPWPVVWKPQGRAGPAGAVGQPVRRGPRRLRAQPLRVGCVLGTCRVQTLSYRLWQLVASAGLRDASPVDPSSPHSYG